MEQKALDDKPARAFANALIAWFKCAFVAIIAWVIILLLVFLWAWGIEKVKASKTVTPPVYIEPNLATQNYYQVATANLTSNITGEAVISMDRFIVPAKFVYDTSIQNGETVIDIHNLEIGVITDITGTHQYSDFTNWQDHKAINTALIAYIKKNKLLEGV